MNYKIFDSLGFPKAGYVFPEKKRVIDIMSVQNYGGSLYIAIPKEICEKHEIKKKDKIVVSEIDGKICIEKA